MEAVRHTAVVLLRKRIVSHYGSFEAEVQNELKNHLLSNVLSSERSRVIRHGIGTVVAAVFKLEAKENGGWLDVFSYISTAAGDVDEARELAYFLLMETSDTICEYYSSQYGSLLPLLDNGLKDGVHYVQVSAVKALGQFLSFLVADNEIEILAPLIPQMLTVAQGCRERGDEETLSVILDVLYDLAYATSKEVSKYLPNTVSLCLECLADANLDIGVRDSAALVIATLAEAKPKRFGKEEAMVNAVVEILFQLIEHSNDSAAGALFDSNPSWREEGEEQDDVTQTSMAQGTLDVLARALPKKVIFQIVMSRSVARLTSSEANSRKVGIATIGVIAEGCSEPIREHLDEILPYVLECVKDTLSQVRECACLALGQLSLHCQPEIITYSEQILPAVFVLLDDPIPTVQTTSCFVLDMFCERLEPSDVRPLLDPLVRKLANLLETTTKRSVKEMAVAALAAIAVAAEEEFTPYVTGSAQCMSNFMALNDEKMYSLRGRALECMGHIAIAVGRDTFRPYFAATMQCACEGLKLDYTDLHDYAYAVFANLAKVMGDEFTPALQELVPHLIKVVDQKEGSLERAAAQDYDLDEDNGNYVLQVHTPIVEAKKGAITALGEMAKHTGAAFAPYLDETMRVLRKSCKDWHPLTKSSTAEALACLIYPSIALNHNGDISWNKGSASTNPMSQKTNLLVSAIMTLLVDLMKDDYPETVGKACASMQSILETCGPHALVPIAPSCLENAHLLLSRKAPCFLQEDEDDADGLDDHEDFLISVSDLLGACARVLGAEFAQYLPQFLPVILSYAKSSRPASDRSMAMATLGYFCEHLQASIAPYFETMYPAVLAGLADSDEDVKLNSVFCAGVCCEGLKDSIVAVYPQLLQSISPIFTMGVTSLILLDNAVAAVCRMISACPTAVPLSSVLPVLIRNLPLKNDFTENEAVYNCLITLAKENNADLAANTDDLKRGVMEALTSTNVEEDLKDEIKVTFASLLN